MVWVERAALIVLGAFAGVVLQPWLTGASAASSGRIDGRMLKMLDGGVKDSSAAAAMRGVFGISRAPFNGLSLGLGGCKIELNPPLTPYMARVGMGKPRWRNIVEGDYWKTVLEYGKDALTVLDVGAYDPFVLSQLSSVPTKLAIDIQFGPAQRRAWAGARGVAFVHGDLFTTKFVGRKFDLVLSSQVVEHIPNGTIAPFVRRMQQLARTLIVSTTYEMPAGTIHGHVQDPISTEKFRSWFEQDQPGSIVRYFHTKPTGDPRQTIGSMGNKGARVEPLGQVAVWRSAEAEQAIPK